MQFPAQEDNLFGKTIPKGSSWILSPLVEGFADVFPTHKSIISEAFY